AFLHGSPTLWQHRVVPRRGANDDSSWNLRPGPAVLRSFGFLDSGTPSTPSRKNSPSPTGAPPGRRHEPPTAPGRPDPPHRGEVPEDPRSLRVSSASGVLQVVLPQIDIDGTVGVGLLAPQLRRFEAHAIQMPADPHAVCAQ